MNRFDPLPPVKLNRLPPNPEEKKEGEIVAPGRFPSWLHRKLPVGSQLFSTRNVMEKARLHTVCEEAKCPNLTHCWNRGTATFLIMGKECTRSCGFCDIEHAKKPKDLELDEPQRIAESVKALGLKHVVITMVARDDLEDGGASHLVLVMERIRQETKEASIEVLTSDFLGRTASLDLIIEAKPDIFNHNIETVRRLTPRVRHTATYERTLFVLSYIKQKSRISTKSGLMVGLGETEEEVYATIQDLKDIGVSSITIGQYLQPGYKKLRVQTFVPPSLFQKYEDFGHSIGVESMFCGPFVRSSYHADIRKSSVVIR